MSESIRINPRSRTTAAGRGAAFQAARTPRSASGSRGLKGRAPATHCLFRLPALLFLLFVIACLSSRAAERPNIVWILVDDMSAHFSCYGETAIRTPHVDQLAAEGTRFARAFVTAPICSISRSALLTGCYQTSIGCQNHRSGSEKFPITLPAGMKTVAQSLREAGYHTSNLTVEEFLRGAAAARTNPAVKIAKTDYNFVWDRAATYDTTHWAARKTNQPFFAQVQLPGGKLRGQAPGAQFPARVRRDLGSVTATNAFKLPPWLPDDETLRADWAQYLDAVRCTDWEVGRIVQRLKDAGEFDRTVIVFLTDHGISHVRTKQFLYDGGIHVPFVARGPGVPAGRVRDDLAEHIDLAATTLALAGLPRPASMQARDLFAKDHAPRRFVFAARDRADETVDRIRSVRGERFKYIRNFYPDRPYLQPNRYKDDKAVVQAMRRLHAEKKLNAGQSLIMAETRPREELYDLQNDPHELRNLAADAAHAATLRELRAALDDWIARTDDKGRQAEPEEVYLNYSHDERPEGGRGNRNAVFERNIQLMLRWAKEKPMRP